MTDPQKKVLGEIVGLFTSPYSSKPMVEHTEVELLAHMGISGDRYATHQGTYSALKLSSRLPGTREPGRQLTLLSADGIDEKLRAAGLAPPASYGEFRRNVVLRNISAEDLIALQGCEFGLGEECRIFVHRHCVPCFYNERMCQRPGQLEAIFDASGVSCEVLVGGKLQIGDQLIRISTPTSTIRDLGAQPSGYFVRPTKRSPQMISGALAQLRSMLEDLIATDPEGAKRLQAAYRSVDLDFWPKRDWERVTDEL